MDELGGEAFTMTFVPSNGGAAMSMSEVERCPDCDSERIREVVRDQQFQYGSGDRSVVLNARMPVSECEHCGYMYVDERADQARHEAICRHEHRFIPIEIATLRGRDGMTQAEFAAIGRFGPASVSRWENGVLLHNGANDQLLYLLQFPPVVSLLKNRREEDTLLSPEETRERFWHAVEQTAFRNLAVRPTSPRQRKTFRVLREEPRIRAIAGSWQLRRALAGH